MNKVLLKTGMSCLAIATCGVGVVNLVNGILLTAMIFKGKL